jgi:hypothetical protein
MDWITPDRVTDGDQAAMCGCENAGLEGVCQNLRCNASSIDR